MSKKHTPVHRTCGICVRPNKVKEQAKENGMRISKLNAVFLGAFVEKLIDSILIRVQEKKKTEKNPTKSFCPNEINKAIQSSPIMKSLHQKCYFIGVEPTRNVSIYIQKADEQEKKLRARKKAALRRLSKKKEIEKSPEPEQPNKKNKRKSEKNPPEEKNLRAKKKKKISKKQKNAEETPTSAAKKQKTHKKK